ncbi:MAG: translation elongation factor Ts [Gemmataceae bacterium]|nr:translation elongation factor Ts [Gemmata sp.]MDW8196817.1 translation elongation factor Ts [Gemmataceae bacterium]
MPAITPQMVKQLRDRTDQPMGLCKQALDETGGDMDKAIDWLRERSKGVTAKREGNETAEGRIGVYYDNTARIAGIVEMRCETAPSAKSDRFIALVNDLAKHAAQTTATDVAGFLAEKTSAGPGTVQDLINDVIGVIREKMVLHRFTKLTGHLYGGYIHHDGTVGVLVACTGTAPHDELLRDVAAHIAALNPPYITIADVPTEVMEKEKALVKAEMDADPKNAGKPANILEKVAEGKLRTKLAEMVLSEQPMANEMKYPKTTVGAALKKAGLELVRFVRFKVGAVNL